MPIFIPSLAATQSDRAERNDDHASTVSEHGALEQSSGFIVNYSINSTRNAYFSKSCGEAIASDSLQFGAFSKNLASTDLSPEPRIGFVTVPQLKEQKTSLVPLSSGHFENWGESAMADNSPRTDTSTDVDTDDRNQMASS